jgi:hypothetical protein
MKTKIKIIISSLLIMIPFAWVEWAWYNPSIVWGADTYSTRNGVTNCPEDSQADAQWPVDPGTLYGPNIPWFETLTYGRNRQSRVIAWNALIIQCQWWDATNPTATNLSYIDGWAISTNISLSWSANDTGWAWLKNYDIRVYSSNAPQNPVWWTPTIVTTPTNSQTYTYVWQNGYAYKFEICPRDNANNSCTAWTTSPSIIRVDTTPPDASNISDTASQNILANNNQSFNLSFNDGGAPVKVDYRFENNTNPAAYDSLSTPWYSYSYDYNRDVSKVDLDRGANGWRSISIQIDKICDQAWNCVGTVWWPSLKTITHFIYANPSVPGINSQDAWSITNGNAVADGSAKDFTQTIKDWYDNAIIPATGINRTISMNLSGISNTMYLNQYDRSEGSSIFLQTSNNAEQTLGIGVSGQSFPNNLSSNDGIYTLQIKAYTPTASSYGTTGIVSDTLAQFWFNTNLVVSDNLIGTPKTFTQTLSPLLPKFKPLYTTAITWDIRNGGFIEGTIQSWSIAITKNNNVIFPINPELQIEFGWLNSPYFDFFGWSINPPTNQIGTRSVMINNPLWVWLTSIALYTNLVQKPDVTVDSISKIQLSTHIAYSLDGKNVVYNSDIIGKDSFWGNTVSWLGNQVGIKILGPIASNTIKALTTGQFDASTSIFSGINRGTIRNNIRKTVSILTRNIVLVQAGKNISSVTNLPTGTEIKWNLIEWQGGSILYMEWNGDTVSLTNGAIAGKRTIILKWLNLYLTTDMYYANSTSILGVILLKDDNGNGWNLYISPNITNMVWSYIIDGSLISYNGTEIDVWDISTLKNQLYIYGSIVSENTIGGSRMSGGVWQVKCPSLLNIENCTTALAQKYDLNYLRRYYLYNNLPFWNGKVAGAWINNGWTPLFPSPNALMSKISTYNDELAKYPVIIEYNPQIRSNPPPAFDNVVD